MAKGISSPAAIAYEVGRPEKEHKRRRRGHYQRQCLRTSQPMEVGSNKKSLSIRALRRMKNDKAAGPDELPLEIWKCMGEMGIKFLTRLFNRLSMGDRMPEEWRRSVLVPIYKNKGNTQCCGNYRGIKLMSHTMKVWERIIKARLRDRVEISKQKYGFMP